MILVRMRQIAEVQTLDSSASIVITLAGLRRAEDPECCNNFNDQQRTATRDAGVIAGDMHWN